MTDRSIVADARTVSPIEFFDAMTGSSPERRAERAEEGRAAEARHQAKLRAAILEMRENIARLLSPERADEARAEWALQDRVAMDLAFTIKLERKTKAA